MQLQGLLRGALGAALALTAGVILAANHAIAEAEGDPAKAIDGAAAETAGASGPPRSSLFAPDTTLAVCPRITVSNAPSAQDDRSIVGYKPFVEPAPGVFVAVSPTNGACLSSGFGPRRGRLHKGIDLQSRPASMIVAAAEGVIAEAKYRPDFGNYVLIDHGGGVYTRYAHLAKLEAGVAPGVAAPFGHPLGLMGATSAYKVALHLHYEILTGDLDNPKGSFGLTPLDPFALPMVAAADAPRAN